MNTPDPNLLQTPLHGLHQALGARLVPFAGYALPVQYPTGLLAEHHHTRRAASLFDVSHMGQIRVAGADAAAALESLMPSDVLGLPVGRQRYGLLLDEAGGILDDLMLVHRGADYLLVVNGACKAADLAHLQSRIGSRCTVEALPDQALLALQGPQAVAALQRLCPDVAQLVFMSGAAFEVRTDAGAIACFITRSGYTGEDGFEISVPAAQAEALARALLEQPEVRPAGLGARNSLRLEAGLCLYGQDIDTGTTPIEADLAWAVARARRSGGARAGGFPGAARVLEQLAQPQTVQRRRVGLLGLERVPVREPAELQDDAGHTAGRVCSGLLSPTLDQPVAMAYVASAHAAPGTRLHAIVRGRPVPMQVTPLPFVPHRYHRG
ncbi:MAG: glycine cleavage system aminomethyltransferase GcvT [Hylemonella sp.]